MQRRKFMSGSLAACAAWLALPARAALNERDAVTGVRAALERAAVAAVGVLGRTDGFLGNPKVRIPLPGFLEQASSLFRVAGQQRRLDELVTAMNRAAEASMPQARLLLVNAVKSMSVEDAVQIVRGGDDAATRFFATKTREPLSQRLLPVVTQATQRLDLAQQYNGVVAKASSFGLLSGRHPSVEQYVTGKALDGLFLTIGEEERRIRQDPAGTGSALLRKVFSGR